MAINLASVNVPNVYTQVIPPSPLLNGVPTDLIAIVGTASWGEKNSPVVVGNMQEYTQYFGSPLTNKYDMGTHVYVASLQGAANFRCVRVTDGTDTSANAALQDSSIPVAVGAYLTAKYTGTTGNSLSAFISKGSSSVPSALTYKLTISLQKGFPEVFDNIGGTGNQFWINLVNAVNLGQSTARGPSDLVIASIGTGIAKVNVGAQGSYTTNTPTASVVSLTGTGAQLSPLMGVNAATLSTAGSGYAVDDTITFTAGSFISSAIFKVTAVGVSGDITAVVVIDKGQYGGVLPSGIIAQGATSGAGIGASFTFDSFGIVSIRVLNGGDGYISTDTVLISGSGGGSATVQVGSSGAPDFDNYLFSGGSNGLSGVTDQTLIGDDASNPRTGMYAARNSVGGGILMLSDCTDATYWTLQNQFGIEEYCYVVGAMAPGYQDNLSGAASLLENAGVDSTADSIAPFIVPLGDWALINDPFNGNQRYISPQSFRAGVMAAQLPSDSSLNKELVGCIGTQKTAEGRTYSNADLSFLRTSRIDVLTKPIPAGQVFGWRFGVNVSSNAQIQTDNYVRMVNFLQATFQKGLGQFIGRAQTETLRIQARDTLTTFLMNLYNLNMIGDVSNPGSPSSAFKVILDNSNNPKERVDLGFMQADIQVVLFSIVQYFVVDIHATQGISIQVQPAINSLGGI
jgi:hypothetical protein